VCFERDFCWARPPDGSEATAPAKTLGDVSATSRRSHAFLDQDANSSMHQEEKTFVP